MTTKRIVIVDDHPLYLEALKRQVSRVRKGTEVSTFLTWATAHASLVENPADLLMLDYSMRGIAGEGLRGAVEAAGEAPVIVMSGVASAEDVAACIAAGARGFLPKTMEGPVLVNAVSVVMHGGTYVPIEYIGRHVNAAPEPSTGAKGGPDLNPRESELLRMVAAGDTNKEIARKLNLQEVTVKFYLTRLFRRLGVKNRSQAAVLAVRIGLSSGE